jgi:Arc/MetJ-type ribon-helix-helix transcriptional regulator
MNQEQKNKKNVSLSLDIELRKEIKQWIKKWEQQGVYETYSSFISKAIAAYLNKELIIQGFETGAKESYHVVLEVEQVTWYKSLPIRKRYKVVNAILKSYLEQELTKFKYT